MRDRALGSTIRLKFTTTDANGAPVAPSSAFTTSDFRIYKDGSATEKSTTNGITVTSPFDSVTGRHLIEIDTSNSTGDSGFWASGSMYTVELNTAKTVNSQAVSGLEIGSFSIELQTVDVRKVGGTAITQSGGRMEVNTTHVAGVSAAIGTATVSTSSTTTLVTTSACSPAGAAADQFKGRVIIFGNSTTTAELRGCAALITASSNSATPTFTLAAALPTSPVSGDTFVIA